jgi:riboflavin-specific deaminase-like protein
MKVTVTWAQSLDGYIGQKDRRMILSGAESMKMTHQLRSKHDAILVGINTVLCDQPRLSVRLVASTHQPRPIVLDSQLKIPMDILFWDRHPIIFSHSNPPEKIREVTARGGTVIHTPLTQNKQLDLTFVINALTEMGFESLMVEGGAQIIASFLDLGKQWISQIIITIAPLVFGQGIAIPYSQPLTLQVCSQYVLGVDHVIQATL